MNESNDTSLYGNADELYPNNRYYAESEPFAQEPLPPAEPLFPTNATESVNAWVENTPTPLTYQDDHGQDGHGEQSFDAPEPSEPDQPQSLTVPLPDAPSNAIPPQVATSPNVREHAQSPSENELLFDRHFAVLMDLMQHGAWPQAVAKLEAMRAEFPTAKDLDGLLQEATLKAELMAHWTSTIKGRRLTISQEFLIRRSLPFLIVFVLFISGLIFYRIFLAPSRQVLAMERANQALVQEAAGLVQTGQIDEAIALYNTVLSRDPHNDAAQQGLIEANRQTSLFVAFDIATRVANSGNLKRSLLMFESIKAKSPTFRDIDARLERVNSLLAAEQTYNAAEKAFAERRWVDAIANYQQTQVLAPDYQAIRVASQMSIAYFIGSRWLMAEWPTTDFPVEKIRDFLRAAQEINPQDRIIIDSLANLEDVIRGEHSLQMNDVEQAIKAWNDVYGVRPAILGGYLVEELYRAYLTLGTQVLSGDPTHAKELFTAAASLPVEDTSEARVQLESLGAPLPPAQPPLTTEPLISIDAVEAIANGSSPAISSSSESEAQPDTPAVASQAAIEPLATVSPSAYQGWIAFRTTRDGATQVYVMRADGSEQKPAPDDVRVRLDAFYQEEHHSADGRVLAVQNVSGRSDANIFVTSSDGSQGSTLADSTGDESDPVWSSAGDQIAFVSNHTGNDEVWVMHGDGSDQRQLTSNTWEWDKHPTWSPDSSQIAFFSNRSGQRQIWVMNSDGSGQRNLSNNSYEDWDPVWLK